jgi:hypothetical protein
MRSGDHRACVRGTVQVDSSSVGAWPEALAAVPGAASHGGPGGPHASRAIQPDLIGAPVRIGKTLPLTRATRSARRAPSSHRRRFERASACVPRGLAAAGCESRESPARACSHRGALSPTRAARSARRAPSTTGAEHDGRRARRRLNARRRGVPRGTVWGCTRGARLATRAAMRGVRHGAVARAATCGRVGAPVHSRWSTGKHGGPRG